MIDGLSLLVGQVAASHVLRMLKAVSNTEKPAVRVSGFSEPEIPALVSGLAGHTLPNRTESLRVFVGSQTPIPDVPPSRLLQPNQTLTDCRNNEMGPWGLVLVQVTEQSDQQGLNQMFHISDGELLLPPSDPEAKVRLDDMTRIAWRNRSNLTVPTDLATVVRLVYASIAATNPPALRSWARFVDSIVTETSGHGPVTRHQVQDAVSRCLTDLNLFPDDLLFSAANIESRRLLRNVRLADLRNPAGREVRDGELRDRIVRTELVDEDGRLLGPRESEDLKILMKSVADGELGKRSQIQLRLWEQLFRESRPKEGLGDAVYHWFAESRSNMLEAFQELAVQQELNDGDSTAADRLIAADPSLGTTSLFQALPALLRRRVERLASKRRTWGDPLQAILSGLHASRDEIGDHEDQRQALQLKVEGSAGLPAHSSMLFALLYGPLLSDVEQSSEDGLGFTLDVDPILSQYGRLRPPDRTPVGQGENDDEDVNLWKPLDLVLSTDSRVISRFRWAPADAPGIVAFGRLIQEHRGTGPLVTETVTDLFVKALESPQDLSSSPAPLAEGSVHAAGWLERRKIDLNRWAEFGLVADELIDYANAYAEVAGRAWLELIPTGAPLGALNDFLDIDMASSSNGSIMLATHPIRLRWFGEHLRHMRTAIRQALDGSLHLNESNEDLYFRWLRRVSPHKQPPFVAATGQLSLATKESNLHEEYRPLRYDQQGKSQWAGTLDVESTDEIVDVTVKYLNEYPHKRDGLAVLLLIPSGDTEFPRSFAQRLTSRDPSATIRLHISCPQSSHERMAAALRDFETFGDRRRMLMPTFRLMLHDWSDESRFPLQPLLDAQIDIAIAPNLFGAKSTVIQQTRKSDRASESPFDPWVDRPTHQEDRDLNEAAGLAVQQVMLPRDPDQMLQAWSTLNVRRERNQPVGDNPENLDYVMMQVAFAEHLEIFTDLHEVAHWVITLDPFIGREQFDAVEHGPEVIVVKEGVGKNEAYTLVVSSDAGKRHVINRLAKRIRHDLRLAGDDDEAHAIAARLYSVSRNVAPGIVLRALGLGRSVEEIIGLVVARYVVENEFPIRPGTSGLQWWIGLDDYLTWFGGANRQRADLLRVLITEDDESIDVSFQVIESKFRSSEILGTADNQVRSTIDLVGSAFGRPGDDGKDPPADRRFWLQELATALSQTPKRLNQLSPSDLPSLRSFGTPEMTVKRVESALSSGDFTVSEIRGIVCSTILKDGPKFQRTVTPGRFDLIRTYQSGIADILGDVRSLAAPGQRPPLSQLVAADATAEDSRTDPNTRGDQTSDSSRSVIRGDPPVLSDKPSLVEDVRKDLVRPDDQARQSGPERGMTNAELDDMYQVALNTFAQHGISVETPGVDRYTEGPGFVQLRFVPDPGVKAKSLYNLSDELKLALKLPAQYDLRAYADLGSVVFEVPKTDDQRYTVNATDIWSRAEWPRDSLYAPIGEDISGDVVGIDFSSSDTPHLLIAGTTGSGKSVALETILRGLCRTYPPEDLELHLIDPKGTELTEFEDEPHLVGQIGIDAEDAISILADAVDEMQRRYALFRVVKGVRSIEDYRRADSELERLPWRVLVLDEYADLTADLDDKKAIEGLLKRLAAKARAAGIHLIVATQKPSAQVIGTVIRSNLPAQLALRVKSHQDSQVIIDQTGAEALAGKGDAFLRTEKGITRVQCAIASEDLTG